MSLVKSEMLYFNRESVFLLFFKPADKQIKHYEKA